MSWTVWPDWPFWKILAWNFITTLAKTLGNILGYFKKGNFYLKFVVASSWATFKKYGHFSTIWSHCSWTYYQTVFLPSSKVLWTEPELNHPSYGHEKPTAISVFDARHIPPNGTPSSRSTTLDTARVRSFVDSAKFSWQMTAIFYIFFALVNHLDDDNNR